MLYENDITPDFVICLDARNMNKTLQEFDSYLANCNCIMDIRTDHAAMQRSFKKIFINFGGNKNESN